MTADTPPFSAQSSGDASRANGQQNPVPLASNRGTRWVLLEAYRKLERDRYRLGLYVWLSCRAPKIGGMVRVESLGELENALRATTPKIQTALLECREVGVLDILDDVGKRPFTVGLLDPATRHPRRAMVEGRYFRINPSIFELGLKAGPIAVYTVLRRHVDNETQTCWPSQVTIGEECGLDRKSVGVAIKKLEATGVLRKHLLPPSQAGGHAYNAYTLQQFGRLSPEEETDPLSAMVSTLEHGWRAQYHYARHRATRLPHTPEIHPSERKRMLQLVKQELGHRHGDVDGTLRHLQSMMDRAGRLGEGLDRFDWLCRAEHRNWLGRQPG